MAWGREGWYPVMWKELRVFLAMILYMDMKKLPNMKAYWAKSKKLFYCKEIPSLFSRQRFLALLWCLHITDPTTYTMDKNNPEYDKMHQTRSLINTIQDSCKREWNLGQIITIDETVVRYKGKYCPPWQYMAKKSIKCGLKVWCAADATSKFIYDFDVYCRKNMQSLDGQESSSTVANLRYKAVMELTRGLENKGHVIVLDNFLQVFKYFKIWHGNAFMLPELCSQTELGCILV